MDSTQRTTDPAARLEYYVKAAESHGTRKVIAFLLSVIDAERKARVSVPGPVGPPVVNPVSLPDDPF